MSASAKHSCLEGNGMFLLNYFPVFLINFIAELFSLITRCKCQAFRMEMKFKANEVTLLLEMYKL